MHSCKNNQISPIYIENKQHKDLEKLLFEPDSHFFQVMSALGLEVKNSEKTEDMLHHSLTSITFKTRCFTIDVNENFVIITALNLVSE